ncbi:MAG: LysM peptidoglycan-binding domain-containing protein [Kiritimatiellae bacterium]|nr:LysM peptidoglycan-binding domain-containing protein [Kiritimatiellia bacterium]
MKLNPRNRHIQSTIQHALKTGIPIAGIFLSAVCSADVLIPPTPGRGNPPAIAPAKPGERIHIVRHGETLSGIAVRYGVSQRAILKLNKMPPSRADRLRVGQRLRIPVRQPKPPPPQPQPQPGVHHHNNVKGAYPPPGITPPPPSPSPSPAGTPPPPPGMLRP